MLIFIADGRLGNNLFQYAFLKTIAGKREKIIVYGFDDLFKVFDGVDVINIRKNKFLNILMYKFLRYFLYFLADKKIISSIQIG